MRAIGNFVLPRPLSLMDVWCVCGERVGYARIPGRKISRGLGESERDEVGRLGRRKEEREKGRIRRRRGGGQTG